MKIQKYKVRRKERYTVVYEYDYITYAEDENQASRNIFEGDYEEAEMVNQDPSETQLHEVLEIKVIEL